MRQMREPITVNELRGLVSIDQTTGEMRWRARGIPAWDAKYAGSRAFATKDKSGYLRSTIRGRNYYAHRVVFALIHGRWPEGDVDHVDRNRSNNSPENLRECSRAQNCQNASSRGGSSGFLGVSWDRSRNKWVAGLRINGKRVVLGRFASESDAAKAYDAAALKHRGQFASLNFRNQEASA